MDCRNELQPESMPKPSESDVDLILQERFPLLHMVKAFATFEEYQFQQNAASEDASIAPGSALAMRREIDECRAQLEVLDAAVVADLAAKSRIKLAARAAQAAAEQQARQREKERKKEAARFYNQPAAQADFSLWSKAEFWTADEAAALLLGKDPRCVSPATLAEEMNKGTGLLSLQRPPGPSNFHRQYEGLRTLIQRAKSLDGTRLTPHQVLDWAQQTEAVCIPPELLELVAPKQPQTGNGGQPERPTVPPTSMGTNKRWDAESLEEMRKYRAKHGTKATADAFGITPARVRQLLPSSAEDQRPSPFPTVKHVMR